MKSLGHSLLNGFFVDKFLITFSAHNWILFFCRIIFFWISFFQFSKNDLWLQCVFSGVNVNFLFFQFSKLTCWLETFVLFFRNAIFHWVLNQKIYLNWQVFIICHKTFMAHDFGSLLIKCIITGFEFCEPFWIWTIYVTFSQVCTKIVPSSLLAFFDNGSKKTRQRSMQVPRL